MKAKNTALIISESRDFLNQYARVFKENHFEIVKSRGLADWNDKRHLFKFDVCLLDNSKEKIDFKPLFDYVNRYNPKAIIISMGSDRIAKLEGSNYLYSGFGNSIHFESFIGNLGEFFKRSKARTDLAAMLIHDVRSPLTSMLSYAELLLNKTFGELNDGQRNFLEKMMILGDQTLDMLEDINQVYRSEQYTFSIDKEVFPVAKAIDQALLNIWIRADQKNIKIRKEIDENMPQIYGDFFQVQRILINLVGNAIKYCKENSTVLIRANMRTERMAELAVEDNGGGIPEADLENIFKKSFRLQQHEENYKGHGLGLYISKLIVKAHGGGIKAENNDIGGVTFHFTLPVYNSR